jgi:hypothetical protein
MAAHRNYFLFGAAAICAFFAARHVWRGSSCRTHIQTAVQRERLPMLQRVRQAERAFRILFPLIEQAQGGTLEASAPGSTFPPPAGAFDASSATAPLSPAAEMVSASPARPPLSWIHVGTFGLVLVSGLIAIWEVLSHNEFAFVALLVAFGITLVSGIAALIWQMRRPVHRGAVVMIWILVISYAAGAFYANLAYSMIDQMQGVRVQAATHSQQPTAFREISPFRMRHMPGFDMMIWVFGIWSILLALFGLIFVMLPAPVRIAPPPLPGPKDLV